MANLRKLELTRSYYLIRVGYYWTKIILFCLTKIIISPLFAVFTITDICLFAIKNAISDFKRTKSFESFKKAIKDKYEPS